MLIDTELFFLRDWYPPPWNHKIQGGDIPFLFLEEGGDHSCESKIVTKKKNGGLQLKINQRCNLIKHDIHNIMWRMISLAMTYILCDLYIHSLLILWKKKCPKCKF